MKRSSSLGPTSWFECCHFSSTATPTAAALTPASSLGIIHSYLQCTILICVLECLLQFLHVAKQFSPEAAEIIFCSCQMLAWVNYRKKTPRCSIRSWPDLTTSLSCQNEICVKADWCYMSLQSLEMRYLRCPVNVGPRYMVCAVQGVFLLGQPSTAMWIWLGIVINRGWPDIWQMSLCLSWEAQTNRFRSGFRSFVINRIWPKKQVAGNPCSM